MASLISSRKIATSDLGKYFLTVDDDVVALIWELICYEQGGNHVPKSSGIFKQDLKYCLVGNRPTVARGKVDLSLNLANFGDETGRNKSTLLKGVKTAKSRLDFS